MGFQDRDYSRNQSGGGEWGVDGLTKGVKYLIVANVAVFLLQFLWTEPVPIDDIKQKLAPQIEKMVDSQAALTGMDDEAREKARATWEKMFLQGLDPSALRVSVVLRWCEFDTDLVLKGQVWRLVTSAFCHSDQMMHIVLNMLALFWFGCEMERMFGTREFLLFYFAATIASSLAYLGLDLATGSRVPAIGASGGVMGVAMLYTYYYPRHVMLLFWILPVQMRWIMTLFVIYDLHPVLLDLAGRPQSTGVAHAAHLGGLAFGLAYAHFQWQLSPWLGMLSRRPARATARSQPRLRIAPETVSTRGEDDERVDSLLQKILESGRSSLSDEEREFLVKASERIKRERDE